MRLSQRIVVKYIRTKFKLLSSLSKRKAAIKAFQLFCTPQHRNRKKLPPIFEKAEQLHFTFHGNTVRGYRWNHPADKKVLILHGFESSVINFDRYIKPLIKKGYEVLAFDAPAHGRSSGRTINILLYKELIETVIKNYGPVMSFMGHSLGGLALSIAVESMAHDESWKLAFIAPATETTTAVDTFFNFLKLDDEVKKEFANVIFELSGRQPEWFSIARAVKNIKAQIFWAHDKDDHMTPLSDVEPVIKAAPGNIQFMITEGLGHRRIYTDSKVSKAVVDFF
ncbi:MAG: alpha/beta hydrolase [Chitinophagaceae bacterium]